MMVTCTCVRVELGTCEKGVVILNLPDLTL
jgi:hypothetical protein